MANVDDRGPKVEREVERGEASWGEWCGMRGQGGKAFYLLAVVLRRRSRGQSHQSHRTMIEKDEAMVMRDDGEHVTGASSYNFSTTHMGMTKLV
jgi:hypothetical protein